MLIKMKEPPGAMMWLINVVLMTFQQQQHSTAHKNKLYEALAKQKILWIFIVRLGLFYRICK